MLDGPEEGVRLLESLLPLLGCALGEAALEDGVQLGEVRTALGDVVEAGVVGQLRCVQPVRGVETQRSRWIADRRDQPADSLNVSR